ncbi:MAG: flavin reductase family protein [Candidatus Omnitrophica bacterium]|nr:flavin reductase family protein [Candidatus Omnitrophota bacterium]MDD5042414.1 flavin reductase family protein [Candidatus Omnitrophota bacterium]MDD5500823.1 flavin reductase family protein [Candidatus Omnitrophota bacterium]
MKKSIGVKTVVFPTPVFIVGTYNKDSKPNAMAVAWGGISCSDPACVSVSIREATYTYSNMLEKKAFTVNIPSEAYIKEADYFGMASGRAEDKFAASGLTPVKGDFVDAPYIKEFPFVMECSFLHAVKVGLHTIFIGQIKDIKVEEEFLTEGGVADMEKIKPLIFNPASRTYYGVGRYLADAFSVGRKDK